MSTEFVKMKRPCPRCESEQGRLRIERCYFLWFVEWQVYATCRDCELGAEAYCCGNEQMSKERAAAKLLGSWLQWAEDQRRKYAILGIKVTTDRD